MRDYSKVAPTFWTGETGKQFRGQRDAQVVAAYLMTCPSANMIGLYYLPLPTLEHEIGIARQGALKALRRVSEGGFAHYSVQFEYVWVCEMARWQIGESLKKDDNRVRGLEKDVEAHRKSPFFNDFLDRYKGCFHLSLEKNINNLPKPLRSPFEAPSKPGTGTGAGTGDRTGAGEGEGGPSGPNAPVPCGEFQQVFLSAAEIQKLTDRLNGNFAAYVNRLDRYSQTHPAKFRKYRSHYAVLLNWYERDLAEGKIHVFESKAQRRSREQTEAVHQVLDELDADPGRDNKNAGGRAADPGKD